LARQSSADYALSNPIESERSSSFIVLTRFLRANRYPPRIKCGAGFRWKTLYPTYDYKATGIAAHDKAQ
jgi:hypothetical protein